MCVPAFLLCVRAPPLAFFWGGRGKQTRQFRPGEACYLPPIWIRVPLFDSEKTGSGIRPGWCAILQTLFGGRDLSLYRKVKPVKKCVLAGVMSSTMFRWVCPPGFVENRLGNWSREVRAILSRKRRCMVVRTRVSQGLRYLERYTSVYGSTHAGAATQMRESYTHR